MASLQKCSKRIQVRVNKSAFIDCLLATAEAAVVSPTLNADSFAHLSAYLSRSPIRLNGTHAVPPSLTFSETGLEVGGLLWGNRSRNGKTEIIEVQRMTPISAVNRGDGFIEWTPTSVDLMRRLAKSASAPWSLIGDFHSHPLLEVPKSEIVRRRLFGPSRQDRVHKMEPYKRGLSLIMSISLRSHRERKVATTRGISNTFVEIDDFQIWMTAFFSASIKRAPTPKIMIE